MHRKVERRRRQTETVLKIEQEEEIEFPITFEESEKRLNTGQHLEVEQNTEMRSTDGGVFSYKPERTETVD